ncbi:MAG: exopolysaccharide biosynthesis polyprenyl glycosylphosphotransferase [bacterium]|nr:exopolysaccharide biosynthesis polyprenyl glycosylphosphotransferase [bacterium]
MSAYLPYAARLRTFLAFADMFAMIAAVWLAHLVRFPPGIRAEKWSQLLASPGLLLTALAAGFVLATAAELYEPEVLHRRREVLIRVLVAAGAWTTAVVLVTFIIPGWAFGRGVLLLTTATWSFLLILIRWFLTWRLRSRTRFPALVVGDPEDVDDFCTALRERPSAPWSPIDGSSLAHEDIPGETRRQGASMVILASGDEHTLEMGHDLANLHFSGVPVVAASEIWAWLEERLPLEALTPALFLHQPGFGAVHWTLFNRLTRIVDVLLACLMLVVSAPVFYLAAGLVLITDGFPVLYRQRRVGQFGRQFTLLKLRTMARDAETRGPEFAAEQDPRTIRIGHLLRRFRIDELPQLLNVLKGEMSLVGPRPERPEFIARLTELIPYYAFRTAVPPGITGWAQVNVTYARDIEDHRRKLEYDLYFIRERSIRLYLLTLLRTVSAALVGVRSR